MHLNTDKSTEAQTRSIHIYKEHKRRQEHISTDKSIHIDCVMFLYSVGIVFQVCAAQ